MKLEDLYIKNVENGIRAIRLGTKKPDEVKVGFNLSKLKLVNEGMHDDLLQKYKNIMVEYNKKNPKNNETK